jgi:RNAse (barnase) inhibitor barstar
MSAARLSRLGSVRRTDSAVEELEDAAEELGWQVFVIDGNDVEDRHAFLEACDEAFELPEWFGMNWDALEECLGDLDIEGAEGILVVWTGWGEFAEAAPKDFDIALDVMRSVVRGWAGDGRRGGVVLVGEGPDSVALDEL